MLKINKENNSIVVEGLDNAQYPHDGNLVFPLNSLMMVLDESDIVTFRSAANADTVFGGNINEIEIGGSAVDKDSIVAAWEAVANASQGGGSGEGTVKSVNGVEPDENGNVEIETSKPNYATFIPNYDADRIAENGVCYFWNGSNGILVAGAEIPLQFSREGDKAYLWIGDALTVGTDHTFNVLFYVKGISEDGTFHQSFEYYENVPVLTKYELGDMLPFGDAGTEWYVAVEEYDADGEMVDWGEREVSEQFIPSRDANMIPMKSIDDELSYNEVAMKWQLDDLRNDIGNLNELLERLLN